MNLLESAGFSRSNPYYVVQQGKVNKLIVGVYFISYVYIIAVTPNSFLIFVDSFSYLNEGLRTP